MRSTTSWLYILALCGAWTLAAAANPAGEPRAELDPAAARRPNPMQTQGGRHEYGTSVQSQILHKRRPRPATAKAAAPAQPGHTAR